MKRVWKALDDISRLEWQEKTTGAFAAWRDEIRNLLVIDHPWQPSRARALGQWQVKVTPPVEWEPGEPLWVSFYQSDNYTGSHFESPWMGAQVFIDHRFKQLLVNDEVVWEQDVADQEQGGTAETLFETEAGEQAYRQPYRLVDISAVATGEMTLTFRMIDRVASTTKLPQDHYRRFSWSACDPAEAGKNFRTTVFFGDVCLTQKREVVIPAEQPTRQLEGKTKVATIPTNGVGLSVVAKGPLPKGGFPIRCGVPLPAGLPENTAFTLRDKDGKKLAARISPTSHWPDGSIRWLLCEFVGRGKGRVRLAAKGKAPKVKHAVRVDHNDNVLVISNTFLDLRVRTDPGPGVWEGVRAAKGIELGAMDLSVKMNRVGWRDHFRAQRREVVVEQQSEVCATICIRGDMVTEDGGRFGPWHMRLGVWADLPYVMVDWTLVNESDQAMAMMLDWSADIALPGLEGAAVDFGRFERGPDSDDKRIRAIGHVGEVENTREITLHKDAELSCRQEQADQARVYRNTSWVATTEHAAGFINLQHGRGGLVGAMRWFGQEYPKGIVVRPDLLRMATMPESEGAMGWFHDRPFVRMGRGEAKRQRFSLWLHNGTVTAGEAERFNACVQDEPRLFNQSWFINSGALDAGPVRSRAKLGGWVKQVQPMIERTGISTDRLGHREYWDTAWSNDYRGRTHLGLIQYVETADPRWYRYFDAACTHNRDVDIIHYCPEQVEWVGASHTYGEDHTACGATSNISTNCDGMLEHYLMTGDPESLTAAAGMAEHLLSCNTRSRSAREVGWPLAQSIRWYDQSGDERFLVLARKLFAAAQAYTEPRRGVFNETHGCWNYPGPVPFMTGYLAFGLIRYHQVTGEPESLALLAKLAKGLFAEARTGKGRFAYSPFPECNVTYDAGYTRSYSALVGGLCGYLYLQTHQKIFLDWTRQCYQALTSKVDDVQAPMDMLTLANWMLRAIVEGK